MKLDDKVVVFHNGELLAVKIKSTTALVAGVRHCVVEPDGNEFYVFDNQIVTFTNRYTIHMLDDMHEMMVSSKNQ
jgi:hypothetical protein